MDQSTTQICKLSALINNFDCLGWIPSVRGDLSLSLLSEPKYLFGDIDRCRLYVKKSNGFCNQHYIAATSLITFDDSLRGREYFRTMRFAFKGSINDTKRHNDFLQTYNLSKGEHDIATKGEILVGQLLIIVNLSDESIIFSEKEAVLLQNLMECDNIEQSDSDRLFEKWLKIEEIMSNIKDSGDMSQDLSNLTYPVISFDVILTRDGLLFLKDTTNNVIKTMYCKDGSSSDHTRNVAMSRVFETAMCFVKYLFHNNYHHDSKNDSFLPVSNLHSIRKSQDYRKLAKHQLNSFLDAVSRLRRGGFATYSMDPCGVLNYAHACVDVFLNNKMFTEADAKHYHAAISRLLEDVNNLIKDDKVIFNTFITQKASFTFISLILVFSIAIIEIIGFVCGEFDFICEKYTYWVKAFIVFITILISWCALYSSQKQAEKHGYRCKRIKQDLKEDCYSNIKTRQYPKKHIKNVGLNNHSDKPDELKKSKIAYWSNVILFILSIITTLGAIYFAYRMLS